MKKGSILGMLAACVVMAVSCSKENSGPKVEVDGKVPVQFRMQTTDQMTVTKTPSNTYSADGFRIFAFRQSGTDWLFAEELTLRNSAFSSNGSGGTYTGEASLPEGVYRFIPTYGLKTPGSGYSIAQYTANQAWDNAAPVLITHTGGSAPELFTLNTGDLPGVADFTVTAGVENAGYQATINRAVARVDVLISRAEGTPTAYTETPNERSVFGEKQLVKATLAFTGVNSSMNYLGRSTSGSTYDYTYTIGSAGDATVDADVLIGTAAVQTYAKNGYRSYNAVDPADVLQGAAHLYGPFLIANADATPTQGAVLTFTDNNGTDRVITIPAGNLPLERNHVTVIKVILLAEPDGPIPPDIWSSDVNFAITLDTEYAGNPQIDGGTIN